MKSVWSVLFAVLLCVAMLGGCSPKTGEAPAPTTPEGKTIVKVGVIKGPTGIGMVNLMEENKNGTTINAYEFTPSSVPQDIGSQLVSGTLDIAAVPTNLAAALYQKTGGKVQILAVNTLGVLHILENGNTITSIKDLKGKTIYSTGQGANPEYILRYVLQKNGLNPDRDVKIEFLQENEELVNKMATGDIKIALVPEPNVSAICMKNANVRKALEMNTEWEAVAGAENKLMMGCVAVRKDFLESNRQAVIDFLSEYRVSTEKANDNIENTATLCEAHGIIPKAAIAKAAIPGCAIVLISGMTMKSQIAQYYQVLYDANPQSIGGKLPDDGFYYVG